LLGAHTACIKRKAQLLDTGTGGIEGLISQGLHGRDQQDRK
jgi:hypothetical protein